MKKMKVNQEGPIFALLEHYGHACKHNGHTCACMFLYISIYFKQCRICGWWRKWKMLRRVQCILTMMFTLPEQYLHACKHNVHNDACTFLYLAIVFKQHRIWEQWRKLKVLERVLCILTKKVCTFKCCWDLAKGPQCRDKGPPNPLEGLEWRAHSAHKF